MEYSSVQLNDLPDEILMMIFKKLDNVQVLYSLIDVNKRLNAIVHDPVFTTRLSLLRRFSNGSIYPLADLMLDRFCSQILPKIHHKIKRLSIEPLSMDRILLSTNYPNLTGLGLYNLNADNVKYLFIDEPTLLDKFKNQISALLIDTNNYGKQYLTDDMIIVLLTNIFTVFSSLRHLSFGASLYNCMHVTFDTPPSSVSFFSSTLLTLRIRLCNFTDCLYLLDGRFNQLHTLYVYIIQISSLDSISNNQIINNQEKLSNLRCFWLCSNLDTDAYVELIVPLLHRMPNLEKLDLYLQVYDIKTLVDVNDLKKNIVNHMPQLNKFAFDIRSTIVVQDQTDISKNTDIQNTFRGLKNNQVVYYASYFPKRKECQSHIYSCPYKLDFYHNITNNFPGGIFKHVRQVSLFDERPFEHEFFLRIAESFPLMKELTITNEEPQKNKRDNNQDLSIIEYHHLNILIFDKTHDDYAEQFLLNTKTCLPNNVRLFMDYKSLIRVTHNFRRDATRFNCSKMNYCCGNDIAQLLPEHFKDYFSCKRI